MKIEKRKGSQARQVLIGMVVDSAVVGAVAAKWESGGLFGSRWENLIAGWCVDHYRKYKKAPNKRISVYFDKWAEKGRDSDVIEPVERLLASLSKEYNRNGKGLDADYLLDLARSVCTKAKQDRLREEIEAAIQDDDIAKAETAIAKYRPVDIGVGAGHTIFKGGTVVRNAFKNVAKVLIKWDQPALAKLFGNLLSRDEFVAFTGKDKVGKSFWVQEVAFQGVQQGCNVAFFEVGDQSQAQIVRRFAARAASRPFRSDTGVKVPIKLTPGDPPTVTHKIKAYDAPMTGEEAEIAIRKWGKKFGYNSLKMSVHPNSSINVTGIESILETWKRSNWVPSIICIAEGSKVLTDSGLVPIENVQLSHKVWDGLQWVSHQGAICKGIKNVVQYAGLTATKEHLVQTQNGWREIGDCASLHLPIARTEIDGKPIRIGRDYISEGSYSRATILTPQLPKWKNQLCEVCICEMQAMQENKMDQSRQFATGCNQRMQNMLAAQEVSCVAIQTHTITRSSMHQPKGHGVRKLWRQGYSIPICQHCGSLPVGDGQFRSPQISQYGDRSDRQRRTLRSWESVYVNQITKLFAYPSNKVNTTGPQISTETSRDHVRRFYNLCPFQKRNERKGYNQKVVQHEKTVRKSRVWDIVNAGPLHRFTVQGILVHNCVDYADILAPLDGRAETRDQINATWRALRALSQKYHALMVTATQSNAEGYSADVLDRTNFSQDKRKNAEVTAMIGINQNDHEQSQGLLRLNVMFGRDLEFSTKTCCYTAPCFAHANPAVFSCF